MPGAVAAFRLGRIAGVPVEADIGFFVAAGLLASCYWRSLRISDLVLGIALVAVLLVSVLVHEFGHAVMARRFKLDTRLIGIDMSGGRADRDGPPRSALEDCVILVAGPLANLGLAGVAYAVFLSLWSEPDVFLPASDWGELIPGLRLFVIPELVLVDVLRLFVFVNVGLFVVNLLPAFPLDGGRILFHLVSWRFGARMATLVVGLTGVCLSVLSVLVLVGTALSGFAILVPPRFGPSWSAVQHAAGVHVLG